MTSHMGEESPAGNLDDIYDRVEDLNSHLIDKKPQQDLRWSQVEFTVKQKKKILSDCWGEVPAGQVCAVLGPSGAGKVTLFYNTEFDFIVLFS